MFNLKYRNNAKNADRSPLHQGRVICLGNKFHLSIQFCSQVMNLAPPPPSPFPQWRHIRDLKLLLNIQSKNVSGR